MVVIPPGEPKESQKPQPPGSMALVALVTACTVCGLFILWRRADAVRTVVSHRLKTLRRPEGRIRLSEDDGLPAHEPIHDDADEDELDDSDDEPLTERPSPKDSPSATASNENRP